jgi:hypothetical protein
MSHSINENGLFKIIKAVMVEKNKKKPLFAMATTAINFRKVSSLTKDGTLPLDKFIVLDVVYVSRGKKKKMEFKEK